MKHSKLILISGMSGAGKSTTSQQLAKQYERNNIEHLWLHEEIANHPIRDGEFEIGDRLTEEGMALNIADMYERWTRLVDEIVFRLAVHTITRNAGVNKSGKVLWSLLDRRRWRRDDTNNQTQRQYSLLPNIVVVKYDTHPTRKS